jgi:hypothetical protein
MASRVSEPVKLRKFPSTAAARILAVLLSHLGIFDEIIKESRADICIMMI